MILYFKLFYSFSQYIYANNIGYVKVAVNEIIFSFFDSRYPKLLKMKTNHRMQLLILFFKILPLHTVRHRPSYDLNRMIVKNKVISAESFSRAKNNPPAPMNWKTVTGVI